MTLNSIEKEWQGYSAMIFQGMKPSDVQVKETKQAFFAGAWAFINAMAEIGEPHISESEGLAYLDAINAECREFHKTIMRRYAETN